MNAPRTSKHDQMFLTPQGKWVVMELIQKEADALRAENARQAEQITYLRDLLRLTIDPMIRLGDFIGNVHTGGNGIEAFDRCEIILKVRNAIK